MSRRYPFNPQQVARMKAGVAHEPKNKQFTPDNCPHCNGEPKSVGAGWIEQANSGPIVACPLCNADGAFRRPAN